MRLLAATIVAALALSAGLAQAQTADLDAAEGVDETTTADSTTTTDSTEASAASSGGTSTGGTGGSGEDDAAADTGDDSSEDLTPDPGGTIELRLSDAKPAKAYLLGPNAVYHYELAGRNSRDLEVQVVRKRTRDVVRTLEEHDIPPKEKQRVSWNGRTGAGKIAKEGEYRFRVASVSGEKADARRAEGKSAAGFYKHKFPVRARHQYGDGFGAGRGHRGQDVFAKCGKPLVAAHAGKVQYRGYDGGGGGYYLVIDGRRTRMDYVYMHLKGPAKVREGARVKTGERIGRVGDTGNASGCHLHFELWSKPGWYEGGNALSSVSRHLKRWDRWS